MFSLLRTLKSLRLSGMLLALAASSILSYASKMESLIQEAIYMFEMKGETTDATALLEKVAAEGDQEDKEAAYFYLGKIQELAGNNTSSNFYYKQSLSRTNEVEKSYWLAERNAATSNQIENFLQAPITIKGRIQKVFGNGPTFLLYQDGTIGKIEEGEIQNLSLDLPSNSQILHISAHGAWYQNESGDSLFYQQFHAIAPRYSYGISMITGHSFQENHGMIQSSHQLYILNKKGIVATIAEKYSGCTIESFFKPTNEYVLNCSDNALHFVSAENGNEERTIAQFDVIQKIHINKGYLFLVSNGFLYGYSPKNSTSPIWKIPVNSVETMFSFRDQLALLEASGRITLLEQKGGRTYAAIKSDATSMHPLAKGTIGLFNDEGAIIAVDTLLHPIWHFNFASPPEMPPIHENNSIYLYFGGRKLQPILSKYYGKRILQSEILALKAADFCEREQWDSLLLTLDSLFKLEPGNAEGWLFKAIYLEKRNGSEKDKQKAWSEAVRLSASNPHFTNLILNHYGKAIGAKYISQLPISPKTRYPQLFGNKKDLFTIDPAADRLFCINPENGDVRWSKNIGKLENSPAISNDDKNLVVASGYGVQFFDLNKEAPVTKLQLPGKAFDVQIYDNAAYITTWNGFLLKVLKPENKLAWSRKIYSLPFFINKSHNTLYTCNLEGEFNAIDEASGQAIEGYSKKIQGSVSHMVMADSIIAIASSNSKLFIFNPRQKDRPPFQILMEASIASLQAIGSEDSQKLLIGLSDQSILLYSKEGAPLWKFKGRKSIFTNPCVKDGLAWIDQGNEILALSLKDGSIQKRFSTPGGAGTPFIMNHTLFSASPKRILYGFSL